jgi:hypothetical protein
MLAAVLAIPLFIALRASGAWTGENVVNFLEQVNQEKAQSISYRFLNENSVTERLRAQPFWGLGRSPLFDGPGPKLVLDSLWIIVYGEFGLIGLGALLAVGLLPVVWFLRAVPADRWADADRAPAAALAMVLLAAMVDNLFNDMGNPLLGVAAGGLAAFSVSLPRPHGEISQPPGPGDVPHQEAQTGGFGVAPRA